MTERIDMSRVTAPPTVDMSGARDDVFALLNMVYGVTPEQLLSDSRKAAHAWPRMIAYYVLRSKYGLTVTDIGKLMGRDHGTVVVGCQRVAARIRVDSGEREVVDWLMNPYEEHAQEPAVIRGTSRSLVA